MAKIISMIGNQYGKLTVITLAGYNKDNKHVWTCLCSCGTKKDVLTNVLQDGRVVSCGCYWLEQISIAPGQSEINSLFLGYQIAAIDRKYSFNLSKAQFETIIKQDCFYCGCKPAKFKKKSKSSKGIYFNGVDRVDNSKGYELNNCVSCCYICNRAKATMSQNEFLEWIQRCFNFSIAKK